MKITCHHPEAKKVGAVLLDGYHVPYATALDTEEGWVEHFLLNEKGKLDTAGFTLKSKIDHGKVTVIWRAE